MAFALINKDITFILRPIIVLPSFVMDSTHASISTFRRLTPSISSWIVSLLQDFSSFVFHYSSSKSILYLLWGALQLSINSFSVSISWTSLFDDFMKSDTSYWAQIDFSCMFSTKRLSLMLKPRSIWPWPCENVKINIITFHKLQNFGFLWKLWVSVKKILKCIHLFCYLNLLVQYRTSNKQFDILMDFFLGV